MKVSDFYRDIQKLARTGRYSGYTLKLVGDIDTEEEFEDFLNRSRLLGHEVRRLKYFNVTKKDKDNFKEVYVISEATKEVTVVAPDGIELDRSSDLFVNCAFEAVDLSSMDFSKVTNTSGMFRSSAHLKYVNLSGFNFKNMINMTRTFRNCSELLEVTFPEDIDTSKVNSMTAMFSRCPKLTYVNLENFNTSNLKYTKQMFMECKSLENVDLTNFDISNVESSISMFKDCNSLDTWKLHDSIKERLENDEAIK